jgi:hypothetical protein
MHMGISVVPGQLAYPLPERVGGWPGAPARRTTYRGNPRSARSAVMEYMARVSAATAHRCAPVGRSSRVRMAAGRAPVESASQCDGAVGLRFAPWSPAPPGSPPADRASSAGPQSWPAEHDLPVKISQIPPNTATAPIRSVGWEPSSELLTWSYSGEVFTFSPELGICLLAEELSTG